MKVKYCAYSQESFQTQPHLLKVFLKKGQVKVSVVLWCGNAKRSVLIGYSGSRVYVDQSCFFDLLGSAELSSALSSLTQARLDHIFTPAPPSSSLLSGFISMETASVARAGVKGHFLWRVSGPWTPVCCCCLLGQAPSRTLVPPPAGRRRLLDSSIWRSCALPGLTHQAVLVFSPVSHFTKPIRHRSILPISVFIPFKRLWGLFERNNNSCLCSRPHFHAHVVWGCCVGSPGVKKQPNFSSVPHYDSCV